MAADLATVESTRDSLAAVGYLADESAALVSFLAAKLGKPVLVEGPAGVGKTELAKALSRATDRKLVRLQCYEGLDEAKALYVCGGPVGGHTSRNASTRGTAVFSGSA